MLTSSSVSVDMDVDEPVPSSPPSLNMLDNEWSMDADLEDLDVPQIAAPVIQVVASPPVAAPAATRRLESFRVNGKLYIRGANKMHIGRYILFYRTFLVEQEPLQLPPNVELLEVQFYREVWTEAAVKRQVKALMGNLGLDNVSCQRNAIDALLW